MRWMLLAGSIGRVATGRRTERYRGSDRDRGSATVWMAIALVAVLAVAALVIELGAAVIARHRAAGAADLAALAGAVAVLGGQGTACRRAGEIAARNGATLDRCDLVGMDVLVTVSAPVGLLDGRATARARAGPERAEPS